MSNSIKILMIVTSQATMGDDPKPTGVWFEEVSTPYYAFVDAGAQVDLASVRGGQVPVDPHSMQAAGNNPASVERFLNDAVAMAKLNAALALDDLTGEGYSAFFLPGGHGTMWDLPNSGVLADLLSTAWANGKVLAAVCHGPAGLVNVIDSHGVPLVAKRRVSAFTDSEEEKAGLARAVPFLLERRIRELGALFERGEDFTPFAIRDGRLVTGQNPMSSEKVAELTLEAVRDNA